MRVLDRPSARNPPATTTYPRQAAPATSERATGSGGSICHEPATTPAAANSSASMPRSVYEQRQSVDGAHYDLIAGNEWPPGARLPELARNAHLRSELDSFHPHDARPSPTRRPTPPAPATHPDAARAFQH